MVDFRITLTRCIGEVRNLAYRDRGAFRSGGPNPYQIVHISLGFIINLVGTQIDL